MRNVKFDHFLMFLAPRKLPINCLFNLYGLVVKLDFLLSWVLIYSPYAGITTFYGMDRKYMGVLYSLRVLFSRIYDDKFLNLLCSFIYA